MVVLHLLESVRGSPATATKPGHRGGPEIACFRNERHRHIFNQPNAYLMRFPQVVGGNGSGVMIKSTCKHRS